MEGITDGVTNINISDSSSNKRNRIQVSNTKKPLFFYVNLAKRYMQQYNEVELSALGMAIATVVTIAEILKNNGLAVEKRITTSTVDMRDESGGRPVQKAKLYVHSVWVQCISLILGFSSWVMPLPKKIEILLGKTDNFDELMAAAAAEREVGEVEVQN